jgi:hypothetical protein
MKFLIAIIAIRFVFSLLDKKTDADEIEEINNSDRVIHPAEYLLR